MTVPGRLRVAAHQVAYIDDWVLDSGIQSGNRIYRNLDRPFHRLSFHNYGSVGAISGRAKQRRPFFKMKGERVVNGQLRHTGPFYLDNIALSRGSLDHQHPARHFDDFAIDHTAVLERNHVEWYRSGSIYCRWSVRGRDKSRCHETSQKHKKPESLLH